MRAITGKEKLSSLRVKMNELCKDKDNSALCQFALLFEDGAWRVATEDVCYARLKYSTYEDVSNNPKVKELVFSFNPFFYREHDKKNAQGYISYILNKCPIYKDLFLVKKSPNYWEKGLYVNPSKPLSLIMMGLISIRQAWEYPHTVDSFNFLVKEKISPLVAYLLSETFMMKDDMVTECSSDGHKTFDHNISIEGMRELIKKGVVFSKSLSEGGSSYSVFVHNYSRDGGGSYIRPMLFKGGENNKVGWNNVYQVDVKTFLNNVREVEKELLV